MTLAMTKKPAELPACVCVQPVHRPSYLRYGLTAVRWACRLSRSRTDPPSGAGSLFVSEQGVRAAAVVRCQQLISQLEQGATRWVKDFRGRLKLFVDLIRTGG
jgi:hypothetical protein